MAAVVAALTEPQGAKTKQPLDPSEDCKQYVVFCLSICFSVRCCALQADSEQLKQAWLSALQGSIDLAYRERTDKSLTEAGPPSPILLVYYDKITLDKTFF